MRRQLHPQADLLEQGLNAHRFIQIMREFWLQTGIELDVNLPYQCRSIRSLAVAAEEGCAVPASKLITLKPGSMESPLFVYAGGASCFLEMQDVLSAMVLPDAILGISLSSFDRPANDPATVGDEVKIALDAVRAVQPKGPYRLLGYSFGGVFALELARALLKEGEEVAFLAMLDTPLSDHNVALAEWLPLMARIVSRQIVTRLRRRRPEGGDALPARSTRPVTAIPPERYAAQGGPRLGHRLAFRFMDPRHPDYPRHSPFWVAGMPPRYSAEGAQLLRMKGLYKPELYRDAVTFYVSRGGSPVECRARPSWQPFLPQAEWVDVPGNHLSMLVGRRGRTLGALVGKHIQGR